MANNEKKEQIQKANPFEIAAVVRQQTLIVQADFSRAGQGDDVTPPLCVYSPFSRFPFAIIDKERKSAIANIRAGEIPGIAAASDYAYRMHMDSLYQPKDVKKQDGENGKDDAVDTAGPAFTKRFTSGAMKGKTPVEVLMEAEDKEKAMKQLNDQYLWLKNNLSNSKYEKNNREQMRAIQDAAKLYKAGKLTPEVVNAASSSVATGRIIPVFNSGFRPLRNREQRNGKTFVYEIKIDWAVGSDYPVTVEIRNYYAKVEQDDIGRLKVLASTKEAEQKNTMALTSAEWQHILYMAQANMRMFEQYNASGCIKDAKNLKMASMREYEGSRQAG